MNVLHPLPRGGKSIPKDIRKRLIDAHEAGISYEKMTQLYGVKKDTAYRICSLRKYDPKPRGGSKSRIISEESMQFLMGRIEQRPDITLREMQQMLQVNKEVDASISTIARYLEGRLYTLKKLEPIPISRNSVDIKEARRDHAIWLQSQHESGGRFCYVDETGFGLYTARTRGRSVKGLPAKKIVCNQRTPHITILCAICPSIGMIHHKIIPGGAKQEHFDQFIMELFDLDFGQPIEPRDGVDKRFVIMDNAPCHRGVETRLAEYTPSNLSLIRLPPYSCELNPIEFCFNSLKADLKRTLSVNGPIIPVEGQTLVAARRQLLINACPGGLTKITPAVTLNSFYHVLTCTAIKAIRMDDL